MYESGYFRDVPSLAQLSGNVIFHDGRMKEEWQKLPRFVAEFVVAVYQSVEMSTDDGNRAAFLSNFAHFGWSITGAPYVSPARGVQSKENMLRLEFPSTIDKKTIRILEQDIAERVHELTLHIIPYARWFVLPRNLRILNVINQKSDDVPLLHYFLVRSKRMESEKLTHLNCTEVNADLKQISDCFPNLLSLTLTCSKFNEGHRFQMNRLGNLTFLDLSWAQHNLQSVDAFLESVLEHTHLKYLDISGTDFDAEGLTALFEWGKRGNQLDVLGLYRTDYNACELKGLPAEKIAGHADIQQLEETLKLYVRDNLRLLKVISRDHERLEQKVWHRILLQFLEDVKFKKIFEKHSDIVSPLLRKLRWGDGYATWEWKRRTFQGTYKWLVNTPNWYDTDGREYLFRPVVSALCDNVFEKGFVTELQYHTWYFHFCFHTKINAAPQEIMSLFREAVDNFPEKARNDEHRALEIIRAMKELMDNRVNFLNSKMGEAGRQLANILSEILVYIKDRNHKAVKDFEFFLERVSYRPRFPFNFNLIYS